MNFIIRHKKILLLHLLPFILAMIIGACIAIKFGQDQNWDLLNYHYYNPFAFINNLNGQNFAPAQLQTFYNPSIDLLPFLLMSHLKPIFAGAVIGSIQGINIFLVYEISIVLLSGFEKSKKIYLLSGITALASFFGAINLTEIGGTMGDNIISIPVLISLFLILCLVLKKYTYINNHPIVFRSLAYITSGIASGLKLTCIPFVMGLLLIDLINRKSLKEWIKIETINGFSLVVGFLASYSFWAIYLLHKYNSPFFPYFNKYFNSPFYPKENIYGVKYPPHDIIQAFFYPFYFIQKQHLVSEKFFRDPRLAILLLLLIFLSFYVFLTYFIHKLPKPVINKNILSLAIFMSVSYVLWEIIYSYYRYLEPVEFLSLLLIACVLLSILKSINLVIVLSFVLFIICTLSTIPMDYGRIHWQKTWFGVVVPKDYVSNNSTILITGNDPISFLVPFFDRSNVFIRTQGNIYQSKGPYFDLINNLIKAKKNKHSKFYSIITADESQYGKITNKTFGFKTQSCRSINTYNSQYLLMNINFYQICKLDY